MFNLVLIERITDFLVNTSAAFFFSGLLSVIFDLNLGRFAFHFGCFVMSSVACALAGYCSKWLKQYYIHIGELQ